MLLFNSSLTDVEIDAVYDYWLLDEVTGTYQFKIKDLENKYELTYSQLNKILIKAPKVGIYSIDPCCPICLYPIYFKNRKSLSNYINEAPLSICSKCQQSEAERVSSTVESKLALLLKKTSEGIDLTAMPYHLKVCAYLLLQFREVNSSNGVYTSDNAFLIGSKGIEDGILSDLAISSILLDVKSFNLMKKDLFNDELNSYEGFNLNYLIKIGAIKKSELATHNNTSYVDVFLSNEQAVDKFLSILTDDIKKSKLGVEDIKAFKFFLSEFLSRKLLFLIKNELANFAIPLGDKEKILSEAVWMVQRYSLEKSYAIALRAIRELHEYINGRNIPQFKLKHLFFKFLTEINRGYTGKGSVNNFSKKVSKAGFETFFCLKVMGGEIVNFSLYSVDELISRIVLKINS